jgi:hypothetical protein
MTNLQLISVFVLAKFAGIIGIIAMFMRHFILSGSLLALDGVLLAIVVLGAHRTMKRVFAEPCPELPYLW